MAWIDGWGKTRREQDRALFELSPQHKVEVEGDNR